MQQKSWNILERILKKDGATLPLIVDRHTAELAMHLFGAENIDWETIATGEYTDISIYRKNEDKKHLSIENMRFFEREIREIPYSGKSLFVLIDFDEATEDAMNAILKILEEPPEYARILLVVSSPEGIIDTIRSRALTFFERDTVKKDDAEMQKMIDSYTQGSKEELLKYIYKGDITSQDAFSLLALFMRSTGTNIPFDEIENAMIALSGINENPKYILDQVFL